MTSAMDILRERLAKGEITPQQYDEAAARLGVAQSASTVTSAPPPVIPAVIAPPRKKRRGWLWFWIIIGIIVVLGGVAWYYLAGGLSTRSITGVQGQSMSFVLTNASDRKGDVVFWANINGLEVCHGIVSIKANSQNTISAPCPQMIAGLFSLQTFWADAYPDEAAKATRVTPN